MAIAKQVSSDKAFTLGKQRNYSEIITYLDQHWAGRPSLERAKKLDLALNSLSKKVNTILVGGSNGKSLTIAFAEKLLHAEGVKAGSMSSPHIHTYNERISFNGTTINNAAFTELANDVINGAENEGIKAHSLEILTMMALKYFANKKVDVALIEVVHSGEEAVAYLCNPLIATLTRATDDDISNYLSKVDQLMDGLVKKDTWFVSADQNKANLVRMQELTEKQGGQWAMPIRKIAPLPYPYRQTHGRCGAIAERIAQLYVDNIHNKGVTITSDTLLTRKKTKRGRPTAEAKLKAQLNPVKTIEHFWKEYVIDHAGRFEILDKEHPCIVLDSSSNTDALSNILLGLRLLHYERHFKGCALIIAATEDSLYSTEFLRIMKNFFRKMSGIVVVCPIEKPVPGTDENSSWNVDKVTNALKNTYVRARAAKNFADALKVAKEAVDQKEGLICITGSRSIISTYWDSK